MKIAIIGNGYLGHRCAAEWPDSVLSDQRINTLQDVETILADIKPDVVLNTSGKVGKPNLDWCESHQLETMIGNVGLPLLIAQGCANKNIYLLHLGSGCIFDGPSPDPKGWKEDNFANPISTYTKSKYAADLLLAPLPNVGIARIRLPMDYIPNPKNLIDKLASYSKIVDVENSITVLEDMIPVLYRLLELKATDIYHVTNPGSMKNTDIIAYYQQYVDPHKTAEWITEESLLASGLGQVKRSTNILQSSNLEKLNIHMRPASQALPETMKKYAAYLQKSAQ